MFHNGRRCAGLSLPCYLAPSLQIPLHESHAFYRYFNFNLLREKLEKKMLVACPLKRPKVFVRRLMSE